MLPSLCRSFEHTPALIQHPCITAVDGIKLMVTRVKMIMTMVKKGKKNGAWGCNGKPSSQFCPFGWLSLPGGHPAHGFSINLYSRGATWPFVIVLKGFKSYFFLVIVKMHAFLSRAFLFSFLFKEPRKLDKKKKKKKRTRELILFSWNFLV